MTPVEITVNTDLQQLSVFELNTWLTMVLSAEVTQEQVFVDKPSLVTDETGDHPDNNTNPSFVLPSTALRWFVLLHLQDRLQKLEEPESLGETPADKPPIVFAQTILGKDVVQPPEEWPASDLLPLDLVPHLSVETICAWMVSQTQQPTSESQAERQAHLALIRQAFFDRIRPPHRAVTQAKKKEPED